MDSEEKRLIAKNKVSSSTQVDQEHIGDFRDVIGHTDIPGEFLSSSRNCMIQDVNLRKQSKGVRPPLVGQASSSSNDSFPLTFDRRNSSRERIDQHSPLLDRRLLEADDIDTNLGNINYSRGSFSSAPLLNRDDYINQRPPEGSSEQEGIGISQPLENAQEFHRVQSPSSASSVTSGRPLEWDSLGDVGYNNGKPGNADGLSSIERIVLAFGTDLLTRSDPEGTTAPSGQPQPIKKNQSNFKTKKIGFPKAQSTPMGTCVTSDVSPETVSEEVISPISCDKTSISNDDTRSTDLDKETSFIKGDCQAKTSVQAKVSLHGKMPLFPEIINSLPVGLPKYSESNNEIRLKDINKVNNKTHHKKPSSSFSSDNSTGISRSKSNKTDNIVNNEFCKLKKLSIVESGTNTSLNSSNKKLSSSLENITAAGKSDVQSQSNTLPRSHSQSNILEDNISGVNIVNNEKFPQYSMALHSLIQYNKSASSSSIATVVHRKGDSPKHNVFAQTSALKQETVGIQVSVDDIKEGFPVEKLFIETPHLPKSVQTKKSNYFSLESTTQAQSCRNETSQQNLKSAENCNLKTNSNIHYHNGFPCKGAHRKVSGGLKVDSKFSISSKDSQSQHTRNKITSNYDNPCSNLNQNNSVTYGSSAKCTNNVDNNKANFRTNTLESVESSARSGGCWPDKHYSVTVEDRVNSFEYLPGHVYENNERQQPLDSRATSSISIQNQTSNNETQDDGDKMWDSSESVSSTIEKYAQRGVDMFSEFVKGSCPNDSAMKKKLIRKVVEKLISKNYTEDRVVPTNLSSNVPWVPSFPQNPERNGRETRRSINRSKVPCEFSSRSEKSGSTNASSECFIPCPAASNSILPSSLRENVNTAAGKVSHSSTSEISIEKSSKTQGKPPKPVNAEVKILQNGIEAKSDQSSQSSDRVHNRGDWKNGPVTKSEKILEELKTRRLLHENQSVEMKLEEYLKMEQENQLHWIRSQIQHLNNFKELLEKQKTLKQCVKGTWGSSQKSTRKSVLKTKNVDSRQAEKPTTNQTLDIKKTTSSLGRHSNYQPTLGAWLEKVTEDSKVNTTVSSAISTDPEMADWMSHHYKSDEHMKSCVKKKSRNRFSLSDRRFPEENQAIYDEPPLNRSKTKTEDLKQKIPPPTHYHNAASKLGLNNASGTDNEGISKRSTHIGIAEEPSQHQSVQANKRSQMQREISCVCQGSCRCACHSAQKKTDKEGKKAKEPVGYYITFEPSPRHGDKSNSQQSRPLEEVRIPVPMSEPKVRPRRRPKTRLSVREEEIKMSTGTSESEREKRDKVCGSETETGSSHSDKENDRPNSGRPIYKGGMGSLQEFLLRNRPVYVSRAEDRRQCIAQMQYLRELREQSKRRLMTLTEPTVSDPIPPPPLSVRRVFSQHTMRRQTEKKYRQLAEVKGKQLDAKRKEGYRTNRQMAEIFTKKLQKRVLQGEVNLSNSVSVISSF